MDPPRRWAIAEVEPFEHRHLDALDEAELAGLAAGGDMGAFGELYRRQAPSVAAIAGRVVSNPDVVADVVQETFRRALERLDKLREPANFGAWLAAIARHVATDHLRAGYRTTVEDVWSWQDRPDPRTGPDAQAEHRVNLEEVMRGIALLSQGDAQAVTLCAHLGLSTNELAAALGVTPSAAKVRLHRARGRLNRILEVRPTTGSEGAEP
jgi:RNA polymerase sigma-70 factor (ECF subfamily)